MEPFFKMEVKEEGELEYFDEEGELNIDIKIEMNIKAKRTKHKCPTCNHTALSSNLEKHIEQHNESTLKCPICEFKARGPIHLKKHIKIHGDPKFVCNQCDYKGYDSGNYRQHKTYKHAIEFLTCEICNFSTKSSRSLRQHRLKHQLTTPLSTYTVIDETGYNCEIKELSSESIHNKIEENVKNEKAKQSSDHSPYFKCKLCSLVFTFKKRQTYEKIIKHYNESHFTCFICDAKGESKYDLNKHFDRHKTEGTKYICKVNECCFSCFKPVNMFFHLGSNHTKMWLQCDECNIKISSYAELKKHKKKYPSDTKKQENLKKNVHGGKNRYRHFGLISHLNFSYNCKYCDFTQAVDFRSLYIQNFKAHIKNKHFICFICEPKFNDGHYFEKHLTHIKLNLEYFCVKQMDAHIKIVLLEFFIIHAQFIIMSGSNVMNVLRNLKY